MHSVANSHNSATQIPSLVMSEVSGSCVSQSYMFCVSLRTKIGTQVWPISKSAKQCAACILWLFIVQTGFFNTYLAILLNVLILELTLLLMMPKIAFTFWVLRLHFSLMQCLPWTNNPQSFYRQVMFSLSCQSPHSYCRLPVVPASQYHLVPHSASCVYLLSCVIYQFVNVFLQYVYPVDYRDRAF